MLENGLKSRLIDEVRTICGRKDFGQKTCQNQSDEKKMKRFKFHVVKMDQRSNNRIGELGV
jgi:hypothetical protein